MIEEAKAGLAFEGEKDAEVVQKEGMEEEGLCCCSRSSNISGGSCMRSGGEGGGERIAHVAATSAGREEGGKGGGRALFAFTDLNAPLRCLVLSCLYRGFLPSLKSLLDPKQCQHVLQVALLH